MLQFAIGEFDMVLFDPAAGSCEIDEQKCELTQHRFGPITGKYVLYRGEDMVLENGITYRNVDDYMLDL